MTCPHCGFENPETNEACFRCGQKLDLDDVEVVPERLRRGRPSSRWAERWRVLLNRRPSAPDLSARPDAIVGALLSLVPGLGHVLGHEIRRGLVMLLLYVATLGFAMFWEPPVAPIAEIVVDWFFHPRWLPLTVHAWIVGDAYQRRLRRHGERASIPELLAVSVVTVALLLGPTSLEIGRRTVNYQQSRVNINLEDPNVRMGDVILVRGGTPASVPRGAVVLYASREREVRTEVLGTVRAVASDVVEWNREEGVLRVNGVAQEIPTWLPGALGNEPQARLRLGSGEILVLPFRERGFTSLQQALLQERDVQGLAVRIVDPPTRRKNLKTR